MQHKPVRINGLEELFAAGDTLRYQLQEHLIASDGSSSKLSDKSVFFYLAEGPEALAKNTQTVAMRVISGQNQVEDTEFILEDTDSGVRLEYTGGGLGPQFFPLRLGSANAGDSVFLQTLPDMLFMGQRWARQEGIFEVVREVVDLDTLDYGDGLEEAWMVSERVYHNRIPVVEALLYFGKSGLLRAEQSWNQVEERNEIGNLMGHSGFRRVLTLL